MKDSIIEKDIIIDDLISERERKYAIMDKIYNSYKQYLKVSVCLFVIGGITITISLVFNSLLPLNIFAKLFEVLSTIGFSASFVNLVGAVPITREICERNTKKINEEVKTLDNSIGTELNKKFGKEIIINSDLSNKRYDALEPVYLVEDEIYEADSNLNNIFSKIKKIGSKKIK